MATKAKGYSMARNYEDLAKKLKALADRGHGGEKTAAAYQLQKLMKKHCISLEEIESESVSDHRFEFKVETKEIFVQVAAMVIGKDVKLYIVERGNRKVKNKLYVSCTQAQALEIESNYHFYHNDYLKQRKIFTSAYIQKNHLLPPDGGVLRLGELSEEEKRKMKDIANMMDGVHRNTPLKELRA